MADKHEYHDCFFCGEKKVCHFLNGKGYVALGQSKGKDDFGSHPMCALCQLGIPPSQRNHKEKAAPRG